MKKLGFVASISVVICSIFILAHHLTVRCQGKDIFPSSSSIAALSGEPRSGRQKRYWLLWCMNYPDCCDIKGKDTCGFACPGCPKKYTPYPKTSTTPKPPNSSGGLAALLAQGGAGAGEASQGGGLAPLLAQGGVGAGGRGAAQSGRLAALLAQGGVGAGEAPQGGGLAALLAQGGVGAGGRGASQSGRLAALLAQGGVGAGEAPQGGGLAALLAQGALLGQGGLGGQQPSSDISDQGFSSQKLPATHVTLPVNSKDVYEDGKTYLNPDVQTQASKANSLDNDKLPFTSDDDKLPTLLSRLPSSSQGLSSPGGPSSQDLSALFAQFGGSNSSSPLGQTPSLELLSSLASQFGGGSSSNVQTSEEQTSRPSFSPLLALAAQGGLPKGVEVGPLGIDIFANEELDVTGFGDYEYEDYEDEDGTLIRRRYWRHEEHDHSSTNDLNRISPATTNLTEYDILSSPLEGTIHTEHHTYNDYLTPLESSYLFGHKNPPPRWSPKKTSSVSLWKRIKSQWDHVRRLWSA